MQIGQRGRVLVRAAEAHEDEADGRCDGEGVGREDTRDAARLAHGDSGDKAIPGGELSGATVRSEKRRAGSTDAGRRAERGARSLRGEEEGWKRDRHRKTDCQDRRVGKKHAVLWRSIRSPPRAQPLTLRGCCG